MDSGVLVTSVGRIASCASWAFFRPLNSFFSSGKYTSDERLLPDLGEDKYCVYAATKDIHQHAHSRQDILDKYGERIVMAERMPDVLSGAMGNEMYTAIVDSEAEVNEFADYVQEKA